MDLTFLIESTKKGPEIRGLQGLDECIQVIERNSRSSKGPEAWKAKPKIKIASAPAVAGICDFDLVLERFHVQPTLCLEHPILRGAGMASQPRFFHALYNVIGHLPKTT